MERVPRFPCALLLILLARGAVVDDLLVELPQLRPALHRPVGGTAYRAPIPAPLAGAALCDGVPGTCCSPC